jgi:thiosulfate dehydrogenase [quinone] large subunit
MNDNRIETPEDRSRREFFSKCFQAALGITVVGLASPLLAGTAGCSNNPTSPMDGSFSATFDVSALNADGKALVTTSDGGDGFPIIIIRTAPGTFTALSSRCTHEDCQVNPPSGGSIYCACHGSRFDISGRVLQGPARTALYTYRTAYDATGARLTVSA